MLPDSTQDLLQKVTRGFLLLVMPLLLEEPFKLFNFLLKLSHEPNYLRCRCNEAGRFVTCFGQVPGSEQSNVARTRQRSGALHLERKSIEH